MIYYLQGEAHKVLQRDSAQLLIISKNVSDKSFSVGEGNHTGPPYFSIGGGAEATSRSTPFFKMEPCIFLDDIITEFKGTVPSRDRKKPFFLIFFLPERNIGDIKTLGYVLVIS